MFGINTGGPAFPTPGFAFDEVNYDGRDGHPKTDTPVDDWTGMTLRDWLAGQALSAILANPTRWFQNCETPLEFQARTALEAYAYSDAMLVARSLPPEMPDRKPIAPPEADGSAGRQRSRGKPSSSTPSGGIEGDGS